MSELTSGRSPWAVRLCMRRSGPIGSTALWLRDNFLSCPQRNAAFSFLDSVYRHLIASRRSEFQSHVRIRSQYILALPRYRSGSGLPGHQSPHPRTPSIGRGRPSLRKIWAQGSLSEGLARRMAAKSFFHFDLASSCARHQVSRHHVATNSKPRIGMGAETAGAF